MREWFLAGGWVMWFLSVLGVLSLLAALKFARMPDPAMLPRVRCLARAVGWATLTGVVSDLAAVGTKIPETSAWAHSPDLPLLVLRGVAESLVPAILGCASLSVVALLVAAGHGRLRAQGLAP
jgi:hypothetical protein